VDQFPTLGVFYFITKTFLIYFFQTWTRATLPRVRIDHVMNFCWKFLVPLSLLLLILIVVADKVVALSGAIPTYLATDNLAAMLPRTVVLLIVNVIVGGVALLWIARAGRAERERRAVQMATIESGAAQQAGK
jgi:NADH:ubiquinone oxidoreductase subunit H